MTTIVVPTVWWHDYCHGTYTMVTWLLTWYLHCDNLTSIVLPTLSDMITNMVHGTWLWLDFHCGTYAVVTWLPLWYLHCGDVTTIMITTLWWLDSHCGAYTVVTWLPPWHLHWGDMTTNCHKLCNLTTSQCARHIIETTTIKKEDVTFTRLILSLQH